MNGLHKLRGIGDELCIEVLGLGEVVLERVDNLVSPNKLGLELPDFALAGVGVLFFEPGQLSLGGISVAVGFLQLLLKLVHLLVQVPDDFHALGALNNAFFKGGMAGLDKAVSFLLHLQVGAPPLLVLLLEHCLTLLEGVDLLDDCAKFLGSVLVA